MTINLLIDQCGWYWLYDHKIDLASELPSDEFSIHMTPESEMEIRKAPPALKAYIEDSISACNIDTDAFFGFADETKPDSEQRVRGVDEGRFATAQEIAFIESRKPSTVLRPTGLYKGEADTALAARSFHSVVLTRDTKKALRVAGGAGGLIVNLDEFDRSTINLAYFIKAKIVSG
ncbi:MAG TPA: hypothetical protein VMS78_15235 [Rhizomicrobium sp.]|nr:hypothetical protein [Rhizomicrobium sp.]